MIPSTQPEMIPITTAMCTVKSRNAVIMAPHPRGKKTTYQTVEKMRELLRKNGAPADILQCVDLVKVAVTND